MKIETKLIKEYGVISEISFAWAVVVNQIYLSNLNKILKFVLMLACLAISGVSTLFSIFLTPLFLGIFQKKQIKFDKR